MGSLHFVLEITYLSFHFGGLLLQIRNSAFGGSRHTRITLSSGSASFFLHRFPLQLSELSLMYSSRFSREAELTGCRQPERDFQELAPVSVAPRRSAQWVSELEPQAGLLLLQET